MRVSHKNGVVLVLLILAGIVLGGFIGYLCKDISWLTWLNFGTEFGLGTSTGEGAWLLDLGIITLTFGFTIKITIAGIIGVIIGLLVYSRL